MKRESVRVWCTIAGLSHEISMLPRQPVPHESRVLAVPNPGLVGLEETGVLQGVINTTRRSSLLLGFRARVSLLQCLFHILKYYTS